MTCHISRNTPMDLQLRPLTINLAALNGLSEELILSHHANNYTGAVKRLDAIRQQLAHLDWPTAPVFMINGLKREELIAANSAWLDRKSTRLNSSHLVISYAVFCLKKKPASTQMLACPYCH